MERTSTRKNKRQGTPAAPGLALLAATVRALRLPEPTEADFTPTRFQPASSKAWFAQHYLRFAAGGFPRHGFTQRFYGQLMHTFGMIAHFNREGFWVEYFTSTRNTVEFLAETVSHPCHGQPDHTWSDVERLIIGRLWAADLLGLYRARLRGEDETRDRAELARLSAKYPAATAQGPANALPPRAGLLPVAVQNGPAARHAATAQLTLGLG